MLKKVEARMLGKGREEGMEKGEARMLEKVEARMLEKSMEKGLEKGREEAVRRLQKYGMDPQQIAEALELPLGTVFRYLETE
jgi:DNA-directed RNA polymerase specialized sigma24 family protein